LCWQGESMSHLFDYINVVVWPRVNCDKRDIIDHAMSAYRQNPAFSNGPIPETTNRIMYASCYMPVIAAVITFLMTTLTAIAGDWSLYSKTGYIDWNEKSSSVQYVRETGGTGEIGIEYKKKIIGVDFVPAIGFWGAGLQYEGSNIDTQKPLEMTSGYFGIKSGVTASKLFSIAPDIAVGPLVAAGTNFFVRTIGEYWFTGTVKGGAMVRISGFEISAGAFYPVFTTNTIYNWDTDNFTLRPKGKITPFADMKYKLNKQWDMGAYFEIWEWGDSNPVTINYTGNNKTSVIASGGRAYQPATTVINSGISLNYHF